MRCDKDRFHFPPTFYQTHKSPFYFPQNFTKTRGKHNLINPGSVQDIHKNARDIMPVYFEGVQFHVRKFFGNNQTGYCKWNFGHSTPAGFRIGGTYQKELSEDVLITPCYRLDINPSTFATNFDFVHYPYPKLGVEFSLQAVPWNISKHALMVSYNSQHNTISCMLDEPKKESGRFILSDLHKISPTLCVGGEVMFEWCDKEMTEPKVALAGK